MRAQRVREGRSRSPPRMRIRDRDYSPRVRDNQYSPRARGWQYSPPVPFPDQQYSPRRVRDHDYSPHRRENQELPLHRVYDLGGWGSASVEVERSRRVSDGEHVVGRREFNRSLGQDREGQFRRLSQFNEALSQEESPSMRFQWRQLLAEPGNSNTKASSTTKPISDYGIGGSRMTTERGYQGSGLSDRGQHGVLPEKHMPIEHDMATPFSAFHADLGLPKTSAHLHGSFSLPSDSIIRHHRKEEDLKFRDCYVRAEKSLSREVYKEEDKALFCSQDASQYTMPMPRSKTCSTVSSGFAKDSFHGSYNDDLTLHSSEFSRSSGMHTDLVGPDGYGQTQFYKSSANFEVKPKDVVNYNQADLSFTDGKIKDRIHPELRRSERGDLCIQSDEYYENFGSAHKDYANHDSLSAGIVDPIVDTTIFIQSSQREHLRESRPWDQHHSIEEQLIPAHLDAGRISNAKKRDEKALLPRSSYPEFGTDVYQDRESLHQERDYTFDRDAGSWAYKEKLKGSPLLDCDPGFYRIDGSSQQRVRAGKLHMHKERMFKGRALVDKKPNSRKLGSKLFSSGKFSGEIPALSDRNEQWTSRDVGSFLSKKSAFSRLKFKKIGREFDEMAGDRISESDKWLSSHNLSISKKKQIIRGQKSASGDIKKQLRPLPWNGQAKQLSVRKTKSYKSHKKSRGRSVESPHVRKDTTPELMESLTTTEPPEGSKDFRQLVQNAFLKFSKQLNENAAQRRKYTERGRDGNLKCNVCGSNSEEFVDTQCLAMHAFVSTTAGLKSQHLGFHKALCLLMGWKGAVAPKSLWVCELLPDTEALALKEDLIIWPPLVIVHNGSIENDDPALRMIVNNEALMVHLIDKGFGGGNAKVCRGKPANQSIMVVNFTSTFSGLQEAERLHKFYADNKHGRVEFQNLGSSRCDEETWSAVVLADKVEHVLYGYLGLAGDLDKLDFETKKRCVVKSKKDIQAIADAPIKTE